MKRVLPLILAAALILSLTACGSQNSMEKMLEVAEVVSAEEIVSNIAGNKARANTYEGNTYLVTGHISDIEDDYCVVLAEATANDNHVYVHSCDDSLDTGIYYNADTVFLVYLPEEELAELNLCTDIQFVGTIDEIGTRESQAVKNQVYLACHEAYYVSDSSSSDNVGATQ